jgi:hypothetical protein
MNDKELFAFLQEGNPNSLGNIPEVFDAILKGKISVPMLYTLYQEEDSIVSMRISNLMKRLWRHDSTMILPLVDSFLRDATHLTNPTFRWTLAQIVDEMFLILTEDQRFKLGHEVFRNLSISSDWICLSQSLKACQKLMKKQVGSPDKEVVRQLTLDFRKAVATQAKKVMELYER